MPVPKLVASPVPRPSGLVPPIVPLDGVTELRVHGVGGTTPESLLGDLAPLQVAGDHVAGFYRSADVAGRHVEAYSWGGLTSRSGTRVLWLLLLPFTLANLAGWMCSTRVPHSRWLSPLHRWSVRLAALAVTLNVVLIVAMASVDVLAYQCGGQRACVNGRWWLSLLGWEPIQSHAGRRLVVGAMLPAAVVLVLAFLSYRTRRQYESVPPLTHDGEQRDPSKGSAAALPDGLAERGFWDGETAVKRLSRLHVAAALAFLALLVAHAVHTTTTSNTAPVHAAALWMIACWVAGTVLIGVLVDLLYLEQVAEWVPVVLLIGSVAAVLTATAFAWLQPRIMYEPAGVLPGVRNTINFTYGGVFLALFLVLLVVAFAGHDSGSFCWGAPFVVLSVAFVVLNAVLLGALIRVAALAAPIKRGLGGAGGWDNVPRATVYIFPVIAAAAPYLTLAPLGLVAVFTAVEFAAYLRGGGKAERKRVDTEYRENEQNEMVPAPPSGTWYSSTLGPLNAQAIYRRFSPEHRWNWSLGRARRLAGAGTDVQYLLTLISALGVVAIAFAQWQIWVGREQPPSWFISAGTVVAGALPVGVVFLMRRGWRNLDQRRRIGMLWDVATFWPRAYHPLAPPCYAERAVPDLQRRLWWLHDNGGTVLVAAHSQGTVLAAAALLQPDSRPRHDRISLITFGSPLSKLYGWAFPAFFNADVLRHLSSPASGVHLHSWRNFYYRTDYIGGRVVLGDDSEVTVNVPLSDPATSRYIYGQPPPAIGRHSGYWHDKRMWDQVDVIAAEMDTSRLSPDQEEKGLRTPAEPDPRKPARADPDQHHRQRKK
jgi:hypothetical protein